MESGGAVSRSSTWITREALNVDEALATPRQSVGDPVSRSEVRAEPMTRSEGIESRGRAKNGMWVAPTLE